MTKYTFTTTPEEDEAVSIMREEWNRGQEGHNSPLTFETNLQYMVHEWEAIMYSFTQSAPSVETKNLMRDLKKLDPTQMENIKAQIKGILINS